MSINWQTVIETGIGSAAGAGIVLLINYFLSKIKKTKTNFNVAISIQLDLHQMLGIALRIQKFNTGEKIKILKRLIQEHPGEDEGKLWGRYGFIHLSLYQGAIQTISSKWILTQFITYNRGKTRAIVKYLADAQLSYRALKEKVASRNRIISEASNHEEKLPENKRSELKEATIDYFDAVDNATDDCLKAFKKIYDHIENEFCCVTPVKLGYRKDFIEVLERRFSLSKNDIEKYFEKS